MAFDGKFVGQTGDLLGELDEQFGSIGLELGAAGVEESAAGGFRELDAKTFGGHSHFDVALELFEIRHLPHRLLQLFFQLGHVIAGQDEIFAGALHVGANFLRSSCGIFEVSADGDLNLFAAVKQPQNDEERHHGGNEVGIGYLPCAAMMAAMAAFFLQDDDGAGFLKFGHVRRTRQQRQEERPQQRLHRGKLVRVL